MVTQKVVTLTGHEALGARLAAVIHALENPAPLWESIGFAMEESTRLRISDQVDVDGRAFIPSLRATEQGGETLRDTGRLLNSITSEHDDKGVEWGVPVDLPYAWILNEGGTIKAKNKPFLMFKVNGRWVKKASVTIPRRQFVGFSVSDKQEVLDIISDFLKGGE